jgi:peptidyl-prolyl cis-trans isomerase B (cyclophilin B)
LFISKFKYTGLGLVALLLSLTLLACGDNTAIPATGSTTQAVAPGGTTSAALLNTPGAATTVAPAAATTASGSTAATTTAAGATAASGATTVSANPCLDTNAAAAPTTAATNVPKPTTTVTDLATLPNISYAGQKDLKASDTTSQGVLKNLSDAQFAPIFGGFGPDKISFAATSDSFDKAEAFFRKTLEDDGWVLFRSEKDDPTKQALLVYQKGGSKVVISLEAIGDTASYPAEFKDSIKAGDTLILVASGKVISAAQPTSVAIPGSPTAEVKAGENKFATIEMEKGGKIVIQLCPNLAPKTVENFEKLATRNFYNGLNFHRVEKTPTPFVVQGGDPKGDGTGGPGYTIPDEFTTQKKHTRGTVSMAHSSAANSAGSQFYIMLGAAPHLDGGYAIFGQVIEGMDIVDNIAVGDKMKSVIITVK